MVEEVPRPKSKLGIEGHPFVGLKGLLREPKHFKRGIRAYTALMCSDSGWVSGFGSRLLGSQML